VGTNCRGLVACVERPAQPLQNRAVALGRVRTALLLVLSLARERLLGRVLVNRPAGRRVRSLSVSARAPRSAAAHLPRHAAARRLPRRAASSHAPVRVRNRSCI